MTARIFSYGAIAGLIVGVPMFVMMVALDGPPLAYGMLIGYTTMLLALSTIFVAVKRYRDVELGGVIRFWTAFGIGLGISAVAGLIYCLAWEAALAVSGVDFAGDYARLMIEQQRAAGMSGEKLARYVAEMDRFRAQYANPLFRVPMTFSEIFPVGLIVSLVAAALLRNSRFLPARAG
ncbi:DUF4199 domain-containing protein [Sphingomonas sp. ID1715]|uniref:DUF4199 domain-containing protein n=1 Tax=Sphingomonas sp. ID1715 TaxID=1656898 RepID=UPI001488561A|nr:DUF4199 domain-containing protein [Sphingomonas sp. ID1715]NNM78265.1 DUF4199 domain-containing protein [Sphingomonas sp. ID1715]